MELELDWKSRLGQNLPSILEIPENVLIFDRFQQNANSTALVVDLLYIDLFINFLKM